jgi:hypothetical protein
MVREAFADAYPRALGVFARHCRIEFESLPNGRFASSDIRSERRIAAESQRMAVAHR